MKEGIDIVREPGETQVRRKRWFDCGSTNRDGYPSCKNRIYTNHFPVQCGNCGAIYKAKRVLAKLGWYFEAAEYAVIIVCAKFFEDDSTIRRARMATVGTSRRVEVMKTLKSKYGDEGQLIPWDYVNSRGQINHVPAGWSNSLSKRVMSTPVSGTSKSTRSRGVAHESGRVAAELRLSGLTWARVGEEMGVSLSYARIAAFKFAGGMDPRKAGR